MSVRFKHPQSWSAGERTNIHLQLLSFQALLPTFPLFSLLQRKIRSRQIFNYPRRWQQKTRAAHLCVYPNSHKPPLELSNVSLRRSKVDRTRLEKGNFRPLAFLPLGMEGTHRCLLSSEGEQTWRTPCCVNNKLLRSSRGKTQKPRIWRLREISVCSTAFCESQSLNIMRPRGFFQMAG